MPQNTRINVIENSANNLNDIEHLQGDACFNRYYTRRIREKIAETERQILYDQDLQIDTIQSLRNRLWALKEIEEMPELDKSLAKEIANGQLFESS